VRFNVERVNAELSFLLNTSFLASFLPKFFSEKDVKIKVKRKNSNGFKLLPFAKMVRVQAKVIITAPLT
jgi:hypothetical protein